MSSLEEIRKERKEKLSLIEQAGMDPYPADSNRTASVETFLSEYDSESGEEYWLSGRIMSLRTFGAIAFADIYDGTERIQAFFKEENIDENLYELFNNAVDLGDFIEVHGTAFTTQRDEKSILVDDWRMLSKTLRPLPEKYHGLQDTEARLRHRYLDILTNPDVRELFEKKAQFWKEVRTYLEEKDFIEVDTPTLELTTGGAEATPFKTYHNDFDLDVFLRISVGELWQKRLMAAGFPRTFEIGRVYRNEGTSPEHLQEFTNCEFYAAYLNFEDGKDLVIDLYRRLAEKVFGTTTFETHGHSFDLSDEWEELDYVSTVEEKTGVNVLTATEEELAQRLEELGVEYEGENRERMTDTLWKYCRKEVSGPALLVNHPKLVAPLSKEREDNPELTYTFQVILAGSEIGRAHGELNDPEDQRERFNKQKELLEAGDTEAMMPDWDYVEAMEHGIPPTFGFGFGERLFSYLVDLPIRETQLFPLMKPKGE
ncbi:MAG: lysine--tRNA ligase [Candidatus Paceibacterota bacterium]